MKTITLAFSSVDVARRVRSVIIMRQRPRSYNFDIDLAHDIATMIQRRNVVIITTNSDPYTLAQRMQLIAHATASVTIG